MKILWQTNVKLPIIYKISGQENKTVVAGWLDQISEKVMQNNQLVICYPTANSAGEQGNRGNLSYYGINYDDKKLRSGRLQINDYLDTLISILTEEKPDVIHIHGTEFQYAYFMTVAAERVGMKERVVVSIQGLVRFYSEHYLFGLPHWVTYGKTVKELILGEGVYSGYKSYIRRGQDEEKAVKNTNYIIGRTNWDRGCANILNPKAEYIFGNETLRSIFYDGIWAYDECLPHSIFVSQASYPIKGFHLLLKALKIVKERYPDVKVRVAGADLSHDSFIKGSCYALYVQKLIREYGLKTNIEFIGPQQAEKMKHEMLRANVFVSPSIIENSPNSLGEGMILGVPCISSDVGGVANLMLHNEEGYIYPLDESYMLAYYIMDIFENPYKASNMGKKAREHALRTHNVNTNFQQMMDTYKMIKG